MDTEGSMIAKQPEVRRSLQIDGWSLKLGARVTSTVTIRRNALNHLHLSSIVVQYTTTPTFNPPLSSRQDGAIRSRCMYREAQEQTIVR